MKFQTQYSYLREFSEKFATVNTEESLTQQSDARDADINVMMARYSTTGQVPQLLQQPQWGDFTQVGDYRTAMDKIRETQEIFQQVPPKIRSQFDNDPAKFLAFTTNPDNLEEMYTMGLATRPKPVQPPPEAIGQPPAPEPPTPPAPSPAPTTTRTTMR